jgi:hypothetical protein
VCTLLGSSPCHSTARLSAYPPAFPEALASDVIPPRTPCGWHLLRRLDRPRRGRTGLLRSRIGFGDGRRVGKLRRDLCGVHAGRAENRRPKVQCHFGSSVSASCAGSTYRRFHSLPVRTRIHLYWRCHRVRLPVVPRSCPLRGLMASRYRGACVSTPHQRRSELHRHPKRVLRLSSVFSFSPEDQSSELKARFLVNGSHFRPVIGGLDAMVGEKDPQRVHLPQQAAGKPSSVIGAVMILVNQTAQACVPGPPFPTRRRSWGHMATAVATRPTPTPHTPPTRRAAVPLSSGPSG